MTDDLLSPDDLFRYYQRGMLDQDTLVNQILLGLIELAETQQAHGFLLEVMGEELSGLGLDVALIADMLRLTRPSQVGQDQAEPVCRAIELDLIPMSLQRIGSRRPVLLIRQRLLRVEGVSLTGGMPAAQTGLSGFDDGRRSISHLELAENR